MRVESLDYLGFEFIGIKKRKKNSANNVFWVF